MQLLAHLYKYITNGIVYTFCIFLSISCLPLSSDNGSFTANSSIIQNKNVRFEKMVAAFSDDSHSQIMVKGFPQSINIQPLDKITVLLLNPKRSITSTLSMVTPNQDGSFEAVVENKDYEKLLIQVNDEQSIIADEIFTIKDLDALYKLMVIRNFSTTGPVPNDISMFEPAQTGFIVNSGDNTITTFSLTDGSSLVTQLYIPSKNKGNIQIEAHPYSIFLHENLGYVSLFKQGSVSIFQLQTMQILDTETFTQAVSLNKPFVTEIPVSIPPNTGQNTFFSQVIPQNPQGIAVTKGFLWISFVNLYHLSPAIFGPGIVARLELDQNGILKKEAKPKYFFSRWKNPQNIIPINDEMILISETGTIDFSGDDLTVQAIDEGGIEIIHAQDLSVLAQIPMGKTAITRPLIDKNLSFIAVGSAIMPYVYFIQTSFINKVIEYKIIHGENNPIMLEHPNKGEVNSIFEIAQHFTGFLFIPVFNTDMVYIYDPYHYQLQPFPFIYSIYIGNSSDIMNGPQAVKIRNGLPRIDFTGPDIFILQGLSSEIAAIDTGKIFGP